MLEEPILGKVAQAKAKLKFLKQRKEPWLNQYQLIGDFVHNRKQNFQEVNEPGAFLTRDIFDNTAAKSAEVSSSAFLGALWPSGAQSFELTPARGVSDTEENREYFRNMTEESINIMDDSRSGLSLALTEYGFDQVTFGTSGIGVFKNEKGPLPIRYVAWDVKTMFISEDQNGFVDTIYNERDMTVRQIVTEYGFDNVSSVVQQLLIDGKEEDKFRIVHAIEPRLERSKTQFGNKSMPIGSLHFEFKSGKVLKETGFDSMPVFVVRLRKAMGEVQGRSFAMAALPAIIELNVIKEVLTIAAEKVADPPLAMLGDGDLGTTTIDTSAGAFNVFNISGRAGISKPLIEIATVGDLNPLVALASELREEIANHFLIDRLLDLNNETRMTLGEANIRNELRGQSLGASFTRQKAELFNNLITRTIDLLFDENALGVFSGSNEEAELVRQGIEPIIIPEEIAKRIKNGQEIYKIKYISPAERSIQAEELQGNFATLGALTQAAPLDPQAIDVINIDAIIRRVAELTGASKESVNGLDSIKQAREARRAAQEQQAQQEAAREGSETMRNVAQAQATIANQGKGNQK